MVKLKLNKTIFLFISLILLFDFFKPLISNAKVNNYVGKITDKTIFNSEYSFTPKFIKNVTTTQSSGMTNYASDFLKTETSGNFNPDIFYSARLTSNSQKGKIWVRYNNVGTYNGQIIDLKITLSGWNYLQPANVSANSIIGGVNYPTVLFKKDDIDVNITSIPAVDSPVWTFSFYLNGTNKAISVKSHITFKDIDGGSTGENEQIYFNSGFESVYNTKNSYLSLDTNMCINKSTSLTSNNDQNGWITALNNGSNLSFVYTRNKDKKGNSFRDITETAHSKKRTSYHFIIGSESIAPFEFTTPSKSCSEKCLRGLEEATYTISHFIPGEASNYYYTSYILTDQIADCFDIKNVSVSDDSKSNRTSWFEISQSNNLLKISAKPSTLSNVNFYNNNFYFNITISKKADTLIEKNWFDKKNSCIVPNTANLEISSPSINSTRKNTLSTNTVNITIQKEFTLPATGSISNASFIFLGITFILIYIILKLKRGIFNEF